jgi:hypothetical protein
MRMLLAVFALAAAAQCQSTAYQSPTYPRLRPTEGSDLYQRLVASDYVAIGTVSKGEGRGERLSDEETASRLKDPRGLGNFKVGSLSTIALEGPVCRGTDFLSPIQGTTDPGKEVHVFVSQEEGPLPYDGHYVEALLPGERYVLFLRKDPKQAEMIKEYELDPDVAYYRTVDQDRGAIRLPKAAEGASNSDVATPFAAAVASLCQAAQAENMTLKLGDLSALKFSPNPAARVAAEAAVKKLTEAESAPKAP